MINKPKIMIPYCNVLKSDKKVIPIIDKAIPIIDRVVPLFFFMFKKIYIILLGSVIQLFVAIYIDFKFLT